MTARSDRISPTAYATGHMWVRLGLSNPALSTSRGRRLDRAFGWLMKSLELMGGVDFDELMLARHRGIDSVLARAIEEGRVGQVVELAAGLSPRGINFVRRYGTRIHYYETDLPAMAATKRQLLADAGLLSNRHQVLTLDALADEGSDSLKALAATLNPYMGVAIITEGLMNYLPADAAEGVWRRIARTLGGFPQGLYLADAYLSESKNSMAADIFRGVLSRFTKSRMQVHFSTVPQALMLMRNCGFASGKLWDAQRLPENHSLRSSPGAQRVKVLEAWR